MTATRAAPTEMGAGAASHAVRDWHAMDWRRGHQTVRRLQVRIVPALPEGRGGKVRARPHRRPHAVSAKAVAVRRVTDNPGKRPPGVDRVTWQTPAQTATARGTLRPRGDRAQPLRRVDSAPSPGKRRGWGMPTRRARALQALYLLALDPIADTLADPHADGCRPHRAPAEAMAQGCTVLAKQAAPQGVVDGDRRACCDEWSHDGSLAHLPLHPAILRQWLKAGDLAGNVLSPTAAGTPPGGRCSPVLAPLALEGLEARLRPAFPRSVWNGYTQVCPKGNRIRRAAEVVITGAPKALLEHGVNPVVEAFRRERGLTRSSAQPVITHSAEGCDGLGPHRRTEHGKLLIKPSAQSLKTVLRKVRGLLKANQSAAAGTRIGHLNPLIRGWAMSHRHVVSAKGGPSVDHAIFQARWRWAKRRPPNTGVRWVKARSCHTLGDRQWVFSGEVRGPTGHPQVVQLCTAHTLPSTRQTKMASRVNPYDPPWEVYREKRLGRHMAASLPGRQTLLGLWTRPRGRCPHGHERLPPTTGWHAHHQVWRSPGGSHPMDTRALRHPTCPRHVHPPLGSTRRPPPVTRGLGKA
jgi:RNA-directed DNA polymerase